MFVPPSHFHSVVNRIRGSNAHLWVIVHAEHGFSRKDQAHRIKGAEIMEEPDDFCP
jgi:hypothetical protein